jgi:hypothetical protein
MPDRLSISLWLKTWDEDSTLDAFKTVLEIFPYSPSRPGVQTVIVQPLDWTEPPAHEQHFAPGANAEECLESVRAFQHSDCAYQAEAFWDVGSESQMVRIIAYSPDFEGSDDEQGHVEIDIGPDTAYRASPANITQLVFLMHALPKKLKLRKRLLWAESGEDVSEILARSVN